MQTYGKMYAIHKFLAQSAGSVEYTDCISTERSPLGQ